MNNNSLHHDGKTNATNYLSTLLVVRSDSVFHCIRCTMCKFIANRVCVQCNAMKWKSGGVGSAVVDLGTDLSHPYNPALLVAGRVENPSSDDEEGASWPTTPAIW